MASLRHPCSVADVYIVPYYVGRTAVFYFLDAGKILKLPRGRDECDALATEVSRYQVFRDAGSNPGLLDFYCPIGGGLLLSAGDYCDIGTFFGHYNACVVEKMGCLLQLAGVVKFIHSNNIVHGHICADNVLVEDDMDIKLIDFAQSTVPGDHLRGVVMAAYRKPNTRLSSFQVDIFAFGSLMYELLTNAPPYSALSDDMIKERFQRHHFPDAVDEMSAFGIGALGQVVMRCWAGAYSSTEAFFADVSAQIKKVTKNGP